MQVGRAARNRVRWVTALLGFVMAMPLGSAFAQQIEFQPRLPALLAQPGLPPPSTFPVQLVLDDNAHEGAFGVTSGMGARQFLWFNRFTDVVGTGITLEQVWVLFPSGANMNVGAPVQIVIYIDTDHDPSNGAQLVTSFNSTIQFVNDTAFSVYTLPSPITVSQNVDVLVGVIPRFIVSGVTTPTSPAAIDTTTSSGRSWVAVWSGDPPPAPTLPPDALITPVDNLLPGGGNWMIRAFGTRPPVIAIPTTNPWALWLMGALLALSAVWASRRL